MRTPYILLATTALVVAVPADAAARKQVSPYIELSQVLDADLNSGDVLTYTQIAAGVDASIDTARASGQVSYRYERRIFETDGIGDDDVHSGLARASYRVARPLTIEGGALATRSRVDIRGAAPAITDTAFNDNITQVYSFYAGPTVSTSAGPVNINAAYRFGYTKVESPNAIPSVAGRPRQDYFDDSTGHEAQASIGVAPGAVLPVGITASTGFAREDAGQLDQRYDSVFARGDAVLPVSPTVALTAGVGYQKIKVSQRDGLVDATGAPVTDANGRFVTDPNSPRRISYNTDGLIYDAGVIWRPSPRTQLTATVAHQYDSTAYTGSFVWQMDRSVTFGAQAYDTVETFGHQLRTGLQQLPTNFLTQSNSFGQQFNGCIFAEPGAGGEGLNGGSAGGCLSDVFQSITTASYRARGVDAVLSASRGRNRFGVGAGYANRHLFSPRTAPGISVYGLDDDSYYLQGFYSRDLSRVSAFDANVFANWYDSALPGASSVFGAGATGAYSHSFGRLGTTAQLGVYTTSQDGYDDQWTAQALVGARYRF